MSIIDAGTLAGLQAMAESTMRDAVTIRRPGARVPDAGGGATSGPPAETETVGRIGPLSKNSVEQLSGDQLRQAGLEELHVPRTTDIRNSDAVSVTSERHGGTRAYSVEGVVPLGTYAVDRVVILKPVGG